MDHRSTSFMYQQRGSMSMKTTTATSVSCLNLAGLTLNENDCTISRRNGPPSAFEWSSSSSYSNGGGLSRGWGSIKTRKAYDSLQSLVDDDVEEEDYGEAMEDYPHRHHGGHPLPKSSFSSVSSLKEQQRQGHHHRHHDQHQSQYEGGGGQQWDYFVDVTLDHDTMDLGDDDNVGGNFW